MDGVGGGVVGHARRVCDHAWDRQRAKVAVIGPTVRKRLFMPDENPVGAHVHIDGLPFVVKGVLPQLPRKEGEGEAFVTYDTTYEWEGTVIHVPFKTGADVLFGTDRLNMIDVVVDDVSRIDETSAAIRDFMFRRHGREGYSVINSAPNIVAYKRLSAIHVAIFGAIAGVSLLVGGIGIVAVSLAAVNQRMREIGIRMAVGARRRDITAQFVVETSVATVIGGAVGALLGFVGSPLLAHMAGAPVATAPWFLIVAAWGAPSPADWCLESCRHGEPRDSIRWRRWRRNSL